MGKKKHSKALWCLNVISDRSNRQAFREKKQRIQKKVNTGYYYFISATEGESLTKDKDMRSE